ncbi:hypothetical protein CYMTET_28292 [Cymbomonas tetramitiformis]|uniref:Nuclear pore protein n=1 Tax=Cymbomonas tetramitiformis TaxID=36881 RepID=A0AAE0KW32_9CHLO|nr:hypothetical protein CYMTET_28292 [Cymbomonas tetramitiformis]
MVRVSVAMRDLYERIGRYAQALRIVNHELCELLTVAKLAANQATGAAPDRMRQQELTNKGRDLLQKTNGESPEMREQQATFLQLCHVEDLLRSYGQRAYLDVVNKMPRFSFLPREPQDVNRAVCDYQALTEPIKRVLPELVIVAAESLEMLRQQRTGHAGWGHAGGIREPEDMETQNKIKMLKNFGSKLHFAPDKMQRLAQL